MSELEGLGEFDMIGIFCDSLNYLQTETDVIQTFAGVHAAFKARGIISV